MENKQRDFKGVWIPREVWLDDRLNALDKVILTEIDSLDNGEDGCYASNKHLAEFCQCSESKISKSIALLISLGYIYVASFDGRKRTLRSRLTKNAIVPSKNYEAAEHKMLQSNIDNNTTNNTNRINNDQPAKPSDQELISEFEELWQQYPRKQGKAKALEAYKRARKAGVDKSTVLDGISRYNAQIKANKTNLKYVMQGSTWFNGKRWEDEYTGQQIRPKSKQDQIDDEWLQSLE